MDLVTMTQEKADMNKQSLSGMYYIPEGYGQEDSKEHLQMATKSKRN